MSLLAWSCRGLGKPCAIRFLLEITQQIKPSIIFLSETLVKHNKIVEVCKTLNFANCWSVDAQGHSGGLALFCKNEGGCVVKVVINTILILRLPMIRSDDGGILVSTAVRNVKEDKNLGI